ncbi:MAG TPA: carboxypeptidase-like regulatory domain-containing protein, partial [Candidatus Acidoferrum sp.]|nr:carboxypeptidase-like regulatory domain-containing protein [Candidatus Acidoferrum sp.]
MRRIVCKSLFLLLFAVALSAVSFGQNIMSTLTGTVTDSSGAAVSGATVTIHDDNKNTDVSTVTTD